MTLEVREGKAKDIPALIELDHDYTTEYVWQMDLNSDGPQMGIGFRETRLPRPMTVKYPHDAQELEDSWKQRTALFVAEEGEELLGYLILETNKAPGVAWVHDLAVKRLKRRQGVGSKLLLFAQAWARQNDLHRLVMEMQSKNHPAIRFAQKLAFDFAGYNDHYYENQDIALFFAKELI